MKNKKVKKSKVLYNTPEYIEYQRQIDESQKRFKEQQRNDPPPRKSLRQEAIETIVQIVVSIVISVFTVLWLKGRL